VQARANKGFRDAWIWPDGQGVRWWTPSSSVFLDLIAPAASIGPAALVQFRDHRQGLNLRRGLATPLGDLMASEMAQGGRLRLHLSESLGSDWHDYPYEWLRLNNAPLLGSLLVERHAPALFQPLAPIDPEREIVVLNLLGSDDPIQPVDEIPNGISRVIDGHAAADHFLRQADLEALGALVVVAHGTERVGETPFRLPDGST
jgi:hypothetical protein